MERREWLWAIRISAFVVALTTLPYLVGYLCTSSEKVFTGAFYDLSDYNSHLAKMQQGYQGSWRWKSLFTSEPHEGGFVNLFYLALGHLARVLHLGLATTYHLARILGGMLLLVLAYRFIAIFVGEREERRTAFLLASLGSGIGWLVQPFLSVLAIDFWLSDFYLFFSIMAFPHFAFSISFLLLAWLLLLSDARGPKAREMVGAALCGLALTLIHPYMPLILDLVLAVFWGIKAIIEKRFPFREAIALGLMLLFQAPVVLYYYLLFTRNPVFSGWAAQNLTLSPPLPHYVVGAGLVGFLAILGATTLKVPILKKAFPLVWAILALVLAYGPWNFQRRLTEGWMLPGGILASWGWHRVLEPSFPPPLKRRTGTLRFALVATASISNLLLLSLAFQGAFTGHPDLFYPSEVIKAVDWLKTHSTPADITLSSYLTGNLIPARAGRKVFLGHEMETVDFARKQEIVQAFFSRMAEGERCAILEKHGITLIFFGPYERALGSLSPEGLECAEKIYQEDGVEIFRVR
jgi:hypothetical protein